MITVLSYCQINKDHILNICASEQNDTSQTLLLLPVILL